MGSDFQRRVWRAGQTEKRDERATIADPVGAHERIQKAMQAQQTEQVTPLMWLVVTFPLEQRGTILPVKPDDTFGRTGDVRWDDPLVSRQHARFMLIEGRADAPTQYAVQPLQDRNGTFVNGERISGAKRLNENDHIEMGDTQFIVKVLY